MKVLVIGATGLLGKALIEEWKGEDVTGVGSGDTDIRNQTQVSSLLARQRPDWTVLAAAHTNVDGCEKDPVRAHQVNCAGALNVACAARDVGSRLLFLSTDYVFDGSKEIPYEPDDPVCPMNVYGQSKAEAEKAVHSILPRCCILRTSWLFGANGRCFPNTILELAQSRDQLPVVTDQTGCPTFNRDLARAIVGLARTNAEGIIHACNAGACSWYEFAREVVRTAGLAHVTVRAARTEDMPPRPARRPKYSVLSTVSLERYRLHMRPWRETLSDYFADRLKISAVRQQAVI